MDYSTTFARHFARLLWLLLHDAKNVAEQKAALRLVAAMAKEGPVALGIRDWHLDVNGQRLPPQFEGVEDLTAQLIGHAIAELTADKGAAPADLLGIARILATDPLPGDGGKMVKTKLKELDASTIRIVVEPPKKIERGVTPAFGMPPVQPEPASAATRNGVTHRGEMGQPGANASPTEVIHDETTSLFSVLAPTSTALGASPAELFKHLDTSRSVNDASRVLDTLAGVAEAAIREGRPSDAANIFAVIVTREGETTEPGIKQAHSMIVRRLAKPQMLSAVASLLPDHRDRDDELMAVLARAREEGAEAVIALLNTAPSLADRRVYFDALLKLNAGSTKLMHMLGDERWFVVRNAAELLGEMQATDAEAKLSELTEHADERVRRAAVGALAKINSDGAVQGLVASLRDESAGVRLRAATALAGTRAAAGTNALIKQLDVEEDQEVQLAILASLGKIGSPDAVRHLVKAAQPDGRLFKKKTVAYRVQAVRALGDARTATAMGALQNLLHDKEKDVREAVFWAVRAEKEAGKR